MSHPSLVALSARLTTTSSLLLERSRVISLKLAPSASSTAQITRNLQSIRADLTKLEAQVDSLKAGKGKGKAGKESELEKGVREAGERYDRLVEMLEEDDSGKERAKALKREKVVPVQVSPEPQPLSVETSAVPTFSLEPPTPALPNDPFTDEHEDEPLQPIKGGRYRDEEEEAGSEQTPHGLLQEQQMLMDDQDERLNVLSTSIGRQNHLSIQIGSELDRHHELLEETDVAMDRTAARLNKAKRRLDKVAGEAKQYGSTITIVALIFVLLILIIVFKT